MFCFVFFAIWSIHSSRRIQSTYKVKKEKKKSCAPFFVIRLAGAEAANEKARLFRDWNSSEREKTKWNEAKSENKIHLKWKKRVSTRTMTKHQMTDRFYCISMTHSIDLYESYELQILIYFFFAFYWFDREKKITTKACLEAQESCRAHRQLLIRHVFNCALLDIAKMSTGQKFTFWYHETWNMKMPDNFWRATQPKKEYKTNSTRKEHSIR